MTKICLETTDTSPNPTELSEKWKSFTAIRLSEKFALTNDTNASADADANLTTLPGYKTTLTELQSLLVPLSKGPRYSWTEDLKKVITVAANLAVTMGNQRCRLALLVPVIGDLEQGGKSDVGLVGKLVNFDEPDDGVRGSVAFVVVPGLRRWGDGFGMNLGEWVDLEGAHVRTVE